MKRYIPLALLMTLMGCTNILEIEPPSATPEIVVIAPFTTDIPWQVTLQKTVGLQDTSPKPSPIENATVLIRGDDGSMIELSHWGGGFYTSPTTFPQLGVTYTLTVKAEGFQGVEAMDQIPMPVMVRDVKIESTESFRRFQIEIQDDPITDNYYEFTIIPENLSSFSENFVVKNPDLEDQLRSFAIQDPIIPYVTRPDFNRVLIRDTPFNGQTYAITLEQIFPRDEVLSRSLYIRTISQPFYDYHRSQIIQANANNLAFSEPANIASNIKNGQGIFAGYHQNVHGELTYPSVLNRVIGEYEAIQYDYFDNDEYTDYLSQGASIELTLHPDYSTTGEMILPPLDRNSSSDEVKTIPLTGAYSIQGYDSDYGYYILTLYHSSDTILRDLSFTLETNFSDFEKFRLSSVLSRAHQIAAQSEARFSGGQITFSRVDRP
ncbi:MAG: DUF4249 domain-containing protein [Bacteroidetes bacterium]|nr:DUF4249 domain-containing protein [Bacteroidota bacterium]